MTSECKFCLSEFGSDPVEGSLCGHVFHTDCIKRWMEVTRRTKAECCPYKCHQTIVMQVDAKDSDERTVALEAWISRRIWKQEGCNLHLDVNAHFLKLLSLLF